MRCLPFLLALAAGAAAAQPTASLADGYHAAARLYIDGDGAQAEQVAMDALAAAPNPNTPEHTKLEALLELIRQQQQDPQQGDEGEQSEQENGQDGENEDAQNQQGGDQQPQDEAQDSRQGEDEPAEDAEPQPGDEGEPEEQDQPEPSDFEYESDEADSDATGQQPQNSQEDEAAEQPPPGDFQEGEETESDATSQGTVEVTPGTMSEAEALRILGALEADEEELLQEVQQRRAPPRRIEKDW